MAFSRRNMLLKRGFESAVFERKGLLFWRFGDVDDAAFCCTSREYNVVRECVFPFVTPVFYLSGWSRKASVMIDELEVCNQDFKFV